MNELQLDSIICHDAAKTFPLPDECIDVVITSPPYWGLRDYGEQVKSIFGGDPNCEHEWIEEKTGLIHENRNFQEGTQGEVVGQKGTTWIRKYDEISIGFCQRCGAWQGQLGLEPHPQMYIDHLVMISSEIKRVLKKTGSFYLNLGDTYGGSGRGYGSPPDPKWEKARGDNRPKPSKIYDGRWLQPKQLMLMPVRVAIALQDDGWILRNDIIWHKPNPMPSSVKDRLNTTFEHVFHFVKSRKYYYDLDAIREPHKTSGDYKDYNEKIITSPRSKAIGEEFERDKLGKPNYPKGKNPGDVLEYDSKYKEGKYGQTPQGFTRVQSIAKERTKSRKDAKGLFPGDIKKQQEYINFIHDHGGNPLGPNPGDFWDIAAQPFTGYNPDLEHFAVFPEELIEKPLKVSCPSWVCTKCGKPRERIIETNNPSKQYQDKKNLDWTNKTGQKTSNPQSSKSLHRDGAGVYYSGKTVGWSDCGCNAGFEGGVVLDPFCGRGTVGKVAKHLGLHYILFDIKPEYCELARLYIAGQKHKIHKDQIKLGSITE